MITRPPTEAAYFKKLARTNPATEQIAKATKKIGNSGAIRLTNERRGSNHLYPESRPLRISRPLAQKPIPNAKRKTAMSAYFRMSWVSGDMT